MKTISIITLGCKVNQVESEQLAEKLYEDGYSVSMGLVSADIYIINTCSVTNEAERKSRNIMAKLLKLNPNAKIYALTPIWRKDCTDETAFRDFEQLGELIAEVVAPYENIECMNCRNIVPEDENLYSDLYLHPNDAGFKYYAEGVIKALERE
jgi:hypothetical protein